MNINKCTNVSGRALHLCKKAHCGKLAYAIQKIHVTCVRVKHSYEIEMCKSVRYMRSH